MRLFLDASVLLAACGSATGASRAICDLAATQHWHLLTSPYAVREVEYNLIRLATTATAVWVRLRARLTLVDDVVVLDRPVLFAASKDRPILFSAFAHADVLLTLDRNDFADLLDQTFYGMPVLLPYAFLIRERQHGRLRQSPPG